MYINTATSQQKSQFFVNLEAGEADVVLVTPLADACAPDMPDKPGEDIRLWLHVVLTGTSLVLVPLGGYVLEGAVRQAHVLLDQSFAQFLKQTFVKICPQRVIASGCPENIE